MSTFYLHVGMDKTGSTAIQRALYHNRETARAAGLLYPALPTGNHSPFIDAQFRGPAERIAAVLRARGNGVFVDRREAMRAAFLNELKEGVAAGLDALVSAETAGSLSHAEATALRNLVAPLFQRVLVLGFVRPPKGYVRSAAQQALRDGKTVEDLLAAPRAPRYRARFEPLVEVFGRQNVRLSVFRPDQLVDGCVLQSLVAMMDIDRRGLTHLRTERVNEAMSLTAGKLLSVLNAAQRAKELPSDLHPAVRERLLTGLCGAFLAHSFASKRPWTAYPTPMMKALVAIPGPSFVLPMEVESAAARASEGQAQWLSALLGVDINAFDNAEPTDAMTLEAFGRLSEEEALAIHATLDDLDARVAEPVDVLLERQETARRRAAERYVAGLSGRRGAARDGAAEPSPAAPAVLRAPRSRLASFLGRLMR